MINVGDIYGDWKVTAFDRDRNWKCECTTCGAIKSIQDYSLTHRTPKCRHTMNNQDMIGKYFGEWEVVGIASSTKLKCKCSCGKEKDVNKYTLIQGMSTNCGHMKNKDRVIDLSGREFGELKVIKYLGDQYWECECSCGNICKKHRNHLLDGRAHDCGHNKQSKLIDITNKRFGLLVAKRYVGNNMWECKCDCGNTIQETGPNLRHKGIVSCGCINTHIDELEIRQFSEQFKTENGRLPYRYEMAEHFEIGLRQLYYFLAARDANDCVTSTYRSRQERDVCSIFDTNEHIIIGDRNLIKPHEIDIYLPDKKLAIEFNGNYWHSDEQKDELYHQNKTIACAKKGIRLVHIFEYEWSNVETQEKIKNMILSRVHKNISVNNVTLQTITKEQCTKFLNEYHLNGYAESDISIGCFVENTLLGVMSFTKDSDNYKLSRTCFKYGVDIIDGYKRMFKYFIDKYEPKSVTTEVDISKFTGNSYLPLGFKVKNIIPPRYVIYNTEKREIVKNYTEACSKIYDSGSLELVWEVNNV